MEEDLRSFLVRVGEALKGLSTDEERLALAREAVATLDRMARKGMLEGLAAVEVFGSFASARGRPGDVDILLEYDGLDPDTWGAVTGHHGRLSVVAIDAGPDGDEFRTAYRAETARRHGAATVRIVRRFGHAGGSWQA